MDKGVWFICFRIYKEEISNFDTWLLGVYKVLKGQGRDALMNDIVCVLADLENLV